MREIGFLQPAFRRQIGIARTKNLRDLRGVLIILDDCAAPTEIVADNMTMLGSRGGGQNSGGSSEYSQRPQERPAPEPSYGPPGDSTDDLPF